MKKNNTNPNIEVLYEDNHLIAINKKAGDIIQRDKTGDTPLSEHVKKYIKKKYLKPGNVFLGVTHRLDRPTTGVVLFAKTSKSLTRMNKLFQEKKMNKTYWAIVQDIPLETEGILKNNLKKNHKRNKSFVVKKLEEGGVNAELHYIVKKRLKSFYHIEVNPKTGRHHQIRVQLAHAGSPIKGDLKYGAKRSNKNGGIYLHARKINFIHPVSKTKLEIIAPTPKDILWNECD